MRSARNRDLNWISVGRLRGMKRSQVIVAPSAVDDVTEISFFKKAAIILAFNSELAEGFLSLLDGHRVQLMATDADGWRWIATNEANRVEDIRRIRMAGKGRAKWAQWTLLEADCLARMQRKGAPPFCRHRAEWKVPSPFQKSSQLTIRPAFTRAARTISLLIGSDDCEASSCRPGNCFLNENGR